MKKVILCLTFISLTLVSEAGAFSPDKGYGGLTTQQKIIMKIFDKVILPGSIIVGIHQAGVDLLHLPEEKKHELLMETVKEYYREHSEPNTKHLVNKKAFERLPEDVYKHIDCITGIINYEGRIIIIEKDECLYRKYRGMFY